MPSELSPSTVGAQQRAQPDVSNEEFQETVVTVQMIPFLSKCYGFYLKALKEHVGPIEDAKKRISMLKRLSCMEGMLALFGIYLHSDFVHQDVRNSVSLSGVGCGERVATCSAIRTTIRSEFGCTDTPDAIRIQTTRMIEAAILFDLVERTEEERPNLKPLRGTYRLQAIMKETGLASTLLMRNALDSRA